MQISEIKCSTNGEYRHIYVILENYCIKFEQKLFDVASIPRVSLITLTQAANDITSDLGKNYYMVQMVSSVSDTSVANPPAEDIFDGPSSD